VRRAAVARIRAATSAGSRWRNGRTGVGSGMVPTSSRSLVTGGGTRGGAGYSGRHTLAVDTFTLFLALRPDRPLDDEAVDALGAAVRPGDDDLRVWREDGRGLLRVATESSAASLETALELAQALGAEVLQRCPGTLLEVSAMGDEDSLVWRAVP
jgi:hypothetical protein